MISLFRRQNQFPLPHFSARMNVFCTLHERAVQLALKEFEAFAATRDSDGWGAE